MGQGPGDHPITPDGIHTYNHSDIVKAVSDSPGGIAVIPAAFVDNSVNSYPLLTGLPILALSDTVLDQVQQEFLLCLQSETGQSALTGTYQPLDQ